MACASSAVQSESKPLSDGPFSGLVICVTGLSKEARKQVIEATERLGGQYSPNLHPQCTHLVVQSCHRRKFQHALKHGAKNGLYVVTLGWFVDSVRKNARLSESLYAVQTTDENMLQVDELNRLVGLSGSESSCLPFGNQETEQADTINKSVQRSSNSELISNSKDLTLSGHSMHVDKDIPDELRNKVLKTAASEGVKLINKWFIGQSESYVVCEGSSARKYLGHTNNIVTPLWVLKTLKEKSKQRLVHVSADLAKQIGMMLENLQSGGRQEEDNEVIIPQDASVVKSNLTHEDRQKVVNQAKIGVRKRRVRRMQACQLPLRPITPSSLLDSICWTVSEPTSTASLYTDFLSCDDRVSEHHQSGFLDQKRDGKDSEASFSHSTRPLTESEKSELIFKNHFLTILFPVDRFSEMGPFSVTFFSENGFTCLQVLDHIYGFYQENMSSHEIETAIHTDSRHADRLRAAYCSQETTERGFVVFRRSDFLGSRKSFEMLKRVAGDNNSNVYELLLRA